MKKDQCSQWIPPIITKNKMFERRADGRLWPCWFPESSYKFARNTLSPCSYPASCEYAVKLQPDTPSSSSNVSSKGKYSAGIKNIEQAKKTVPLGKSQIPPISARNTPNTSGYISSVSLPNILHERNKNKKISKRRAGKQNVQSFQHDESSPTEEDSPLEGGLESASDKMIGRRTCSELPSRDHSKSSEISLPEKQYKKCQIEKKTLDCKVKTLYTRSPRKKSTMLRKANIGKTKSTDTIFSILPKMSFVDTDDRRGINIVEIPLDFSDNFPKHIAEDSFVENKRISDAQIGLNLLHDSQREILDDDDEMERCTDKTGPSDKKLLKEFKMTWGPPEEKDGTLLDISPIVSECLEDDLHSPGDIVCVNEFVAKIDSFTNHEKGTCSHNFLKSSFETTLKNTRQRNAPIDTKVKNLKVRKWDWDSNINGADNIPAWFLNLIEGHYSKKYKEGERRNSNKLQ